MRLFGVRVTHQEMCCTEKNHVYVLYCFIRSPRSNLLSTTFSCTLKKQYYTPILGFHVLPLSLKILFLYRFNFYYLFPSYLIFTAIALLAPGNLVSHFLCHQASGLCHVFVCSHFPNIRYIR
uniref:Uncharacterized protein n=1 Tax=Cynoglossus semilaevis TaxID=244447 RepID=A0A3P8V6Q0_CYNSE